MLHVSVLLTGFHQAYKHKSETQNYMHVEYINLRTLKYYSLVFSFFFSFSGEGLFSCKRRKLKYLCTIGFIRKVVPLIKIFKVVLDEHGDLGISLL
jgi:hypothetical protein